MKMKEPKKGSERGGEERERKRFANRTCVIA